MTFQISQRAKECLTAAQTLLRAAQAMTDSAIADQLEALANDFQRQAEGENRVACAGSLDPPSARVARSEDRPLPAHHDRARQHRQRDGAGLWLPHADAGLSHASSH
jgi:hypothetical protein